MSASGAAELRLDPAPARWRALARARFDALDGRARRFRQQLGLPLDRPIIMTGHQATWWHAGILAKFIAAEAAANDADAAVAWICPDQDERGFSTLRLPTMVRDGAGAASRRGLRVERAAIGPDIAPGVAAASRPPFAPRAPKLAGEPALPSAAAGLARVVETLERHRAKPTGAKQVMAALADLAAPTVAPAPMIFASELHGADLFQEIVQRLTREPAAAAAAYNRAVERYPDATLATLRSRKGVWETPLWRLTPGAPRRRVFADELARIPLRELAPRAILMTGLLRLAACDLFIHGEGGERYDRAAEAWLKDWLGAALAPIAVATATMTLPLAGGAIVSAREAARARWLAHHALHNPAAVGDGARDAQKRALLQRIEALKKAGQAPGDAFAALHRFLAAYRSERAADLRALERKADEAARALAARELLEDRTWAFFLHEPAALESLREAIRARFSAPAPTSPTCAAPS